MTMKKDEFDSIKYTRQQRDILSKKLLKMSPTEVVSYFDKIKTSTTVKPKHRTQS